MMHIKVFPVRIWITYKDFVPFDILALMFKSLDIKLSF